MNHKETTVFKSIKKTLDEFNKHTAVLIFSYKNVILTVNTEVYICHQLN